LAYIRPHCIALFKKTKLKINTSPIFSTSVIA